MPRLTIFRPANAGGWNDPYDYCRRCYPRNLRVAQSRFIGVEPSDIDMDVDHPDYGQDLYDCESCSRTLTDNDN